jgi:hypothetical protein
LAGSQNLPYIVILDKENNPMVTLDNLIYDSGNSTTWPLQMHRVSLVNDSQTSSLKFQMLLSERLYTSVACYSILLPMGRKLPREFQLETILALSAGRDVVI